jgi:CRISPR-associated endonuclease/helicase Cas3
MPKFTPPTNLKTAIIPLDECLAKTIKKDDGTKIKGVSVFTHCKIVGLIAKELINRQPQWIKDLLFPKGSELVAAVHDIGKVSPYR